MQGNKRKKTRINIQMVKIGQTEQRDLLAHTQTGQSININIKTMI